jgi:hypothetical protein
MCEWRRPRLLKPTAITMATPRAGLVGRGQGGASTQNCLETFEALRDSQTNVRGIRAKICQKRKLKFSPSDPSIGKWAENPSDRFVNEHAWVLSMMNQFGMIEKSINVRIKPLFCPAETYSCRRSSTSFGATNRLSGSRVVQEGARMVSHRRFAHSSQDRIRNERTREKSRSCVTSAAALTASALAV